jgi:prepilin-type N-terminal cleavage/methylation domain-containing protein
MRTARFDRERGFSLLEMMIVAGVLGILSGIWIQNAQFSLQETRAMACEKNRLLMEEQEKLFAHQVGRPTLALQELVDEKYVSRCACPRGGILTWEVTDPSLSYAHQTLVCSLHGPRTRIAAWKVVAATPEDGSALSDPFDEDVAAGWTETRGQYWEVVDGTYHAGLPGGKSKEHRSFTGSDAWEDYTVTLTATLEEGKAFGVYFRTTDPTKPDGYLFEYVSSSGKGAFQLRKVVDGKNESPFAKTRVPKGYEWHGEEREIEIRVSGDTYTVYVDGGGRVRIRLHLLERRSRPPHPQEHRGVVRRRTSGAGLGVALP